MFPSSCGSVSRFSPPDKPHLSLSLSLSLSRFFSASSPNFSPFLSSASSLADSPYSYPAAASNASSASSVQLASALFTRPYPLFAVMDLAADCITACKYSEIATVHGSVGDYCTGLGERVGSRLRESRRGGEFTLPWAHSFAQPPFLKIIEHIARIKRISAATGTLDS